MCEGQFVEVQTQHQCREERKFTLISREGWSEKSLSKWPLRSHTRDIQIRFILCFFSLQSEQPISNFFNFPKNSQFCYESNSFQSVCSLNIVVAFHPTFASSIWGNSAPEEARRCKSWHKQYLTVIIMNQYAIKWPFLLLVLSFVSFLLLMILWRYCWLNKFKIGQ